MDHLVRLRPRALAVEFGRTMWGGVRNLETMRSRFTQRRKGAEKDKEKEERGKMVGSAVGITGKIKRNEERGLSCGVQASPGRFGVRGEQVAGGGVAGIALTDGTVGRGRAGALVDTGPHGVMRPWQNCWKKVLHRGGLSEGWAWWLGKEKYGYQRSHIAYRAASTRLRGGRCVIRRWRGCFLGWEE